MVQAEISTRRCTRASYLPKNLANRSMANGGKSRSPHLGSRLSSRVPIARNCLLASFHRMGFRNRSENDRDRRHRLKRIIVAEDKSCFSQTTKTSARSLDRSSPSLLKRTKCTATTPNGKAPPFWLDAFRTDPTGKPIVPPRAMRQRDTNLVAYISTVGTVYRFRDENPLVTRIISLVSQSRMISQPTLWASCAARCTA